MKVIRRLAEAGLNAVVATTLAACAVTGNPMPDRSGDTLEPLADDSPGRLSARPLRSPPGEADTGLRPFRLDGRESYLFVPHSYNSARPAPFIVALHGAGANSRKAIGLFLTHARATGSIVFAPQSQDRTWDVIAGGFGPDVAFVDQALEDIFGRYRIDPSRIAVTGFSDGASYALTLGLINGDVFKHIIALSPGFVMPGPRHGRPRIFIAHGRRDSVLRYEATSKVIAPRLVDGGYEVVFETHPGGHSPMPRLAEALNWLIQ